MWIRNQDKTKLVKCDNFYIQITNTGNYAVTTFIEGTFYLGVYKTKEKALEVLDLIEKYINSGGVIFTIDQCKTDLGMTAVYEKKLGVFQMPHDNEVEDE